MELKVLQWSDDGRKTISDRLPDESMAEGSYWIDVAVGDGDTTPLHELGDRLGLDRLSVHDALNETDLPKVDDFGHHLVIVLHGLSDDRIETYEIVCFLTATALVTVRRTTSPALASLWAAVTDRQELVGSVDELAARLADVMTRRLATVVDLFDHRVEGLVDRALDADKSVIRDLSAVRTDVAVVRRAVHPQREMLDVLRRSRSGLLSDAGRRRFSDVFDVASRTASGLDAARSSLAETLDIYRGAEAGKATEVSKVLTVYAATMLPLSLIAGFFGMNHTSLPGLDSERGLLLVLAAMVVVAVVSLGMFVALGWIRRPSGREAGTALGRGLIEAARAPVEVAEAVYAISTMPIRMTSGRRTPANRRAQGSDG